MICYLSAIQLSFMLCKIMRSILLEVKTIFTQEV